MIHCPPASAPVLFVTVCAWGKYRSALHEGQGDGALLSILSSNSSLSLKNDITKQYFVAVLRKNCISIVVGILLAVAFVVTIEKTLVESRDTTEGGLEAGYTRVHKEN